MLGKFKLIAELGRGGMSEVYLAVIAGPAGFNKLVVIKLIKAELAEDPDFINMFLEEARLSARLSHPNIVQTNEVGEVGGRYYIAMEYLEGQPYSRILHRLGRDRGLPLGMSLRVLSDVLAGLHYAHELADFDGSALGVVHRDVTPHNVFVTYDGQVKVVDFGIAKAMNSSHETRTGMLKGKVGYMAPEQAKGERVDRRADLFSVGVMLWEAAVGRRLWKGLNEVQILHQLLSGEIPSPRSMRPDISVPLEQLIMKALSPDRDKRHSSAVELQTALDELMDSGSERSTLREVGRLLSKTFEEERKKLKTIIEQQVARSAMLPTGQYQHMAIPQVDQPPAYTGELQRASFSGPASLAGGNLPQLGYGSAPNYLTASGSHPAAGSNPQLTQSGHSHPNMRDPSFTGSGQHTPSNRMNPYTQSGSVPRVGPGMTGDDHASHPSVSNSLAHVSVSHSPYGHPHGKASDGGSKKLTMIALGIAAAAGGLAALLYIGLGRSPSAPAAAASGSPASQSTAPATTAAATATAQATSTSTAAASSDANAKEATLELKVKPDEAEIFLDGKKIGQGNMKTTIPRDGQEHELKVDAPGYSGKVRKIKPDETSIVWEPVLTADRRYGGSPPPSKTTTTPTTDPVPTVKRDKNGRPIRDIDKEYPGGG
ncbi:MAG: serine/threonine protein kinase [Polyangiaceae bacterium]|nr:serine/threonine protein kinase [Polyangiaceae bacterium]